MSFRFKQLVSSVIVSFSVFAADLETQQTHEEVTRPDHNVMETQVFYNVSENILTIDVEKTYNSAFQFSWTDPFAFLVPSFKRYEAFYKDGYGLDFNHLQFMILQLADVEISGSSDIWWGNPWSWLYSCSQSLEDAIVINRFKEKFPQIRTIALKTTYGYPVEIENYHESGWLRYKDGRVILS